MQRAGVLALVLAATACDESGILQDYPVPTLDVRLDSPVYGEFAGEGDFHVKGTIVPSDALLRVEDRWVEVAEDGSFDVAVPFDRPYRILDIWAAYDDGRFEARVPVFEGFDPLSTFPGAITARVTPTGLDGLAVLLEGVIADQLTQLDLSTLVPPIGGNGFTLDLQDLTYGDLSIALAPGATALTADVELTDLRVDFIGGFDLFGNPISVPGAITLPVIGLGVDLGVRIDDTGSLVVSLGEVDVQADVPGVELFGANLDFLANLVRNFLDIQALIDQALQGALGQGQELPLAGPLAFETDLLGTSLSLEVLDARTDALGIGLGIGLGLGGDVPASARDVPVPDGDMDPQPDVAVLLHDGVLQTLLASDLLALLDQDLQLPGLVGNFLQPVLERLPGGGDIPSNNGWCIGIKPGDARVARFGKTSADPLVGIYLPDAAVSFSYLADDGSGCTPWLETSLALELLLDITEGTKVGLELAAPEGKVLAYGAGEGFDEELIVSELSGLLERLLGLLGGFTSFDLADLLGGAGGGGGGGGGLGGIPLDGLQIDLGQRRPVIGADGQPVDGMVELGMGLFGSGG